MNIPYLQLLLLGAVAGFTIYLGLPLAFIPRVGKKTKSFLNVFSAGVLIFLLYEIMEEMFEEVGHNYLNLQQGLVSSGELLGQISLIVIGLILGLGGLIVFENKYIAKSKPETQLNRRGSHLALMIAIGIGLHNLGEGLAIGQAFIQGSMGLAFTLVIGFGLHNATEGFGIVAPLSGEKPKLSFIALLGLIGGGPTFLGTMIGSFYASEILEIIFLSIAAGSILYVVVKLLQIEYRVKQYQASLAGALSGFFLAWGSEWIAKAAMHF
ncbi:MAG: hypothetical protein RBG1_1C00001G0863 [candidate division Zixibacteria bacterium RBG-1]|nr:MAG: hypothetical protein RBG1_1C00001G0863 [candidate division Zixibacteria bacterium RBG-1]OGC83637.1 MAG: hypothetical protein A2V73_03370 [candidate division Zixibacteria bacterium RBG_19FT_COMBO_42_43]